MTLVPITTHTQDALARLLEQYRNLPLMQGLLTALTQDIQNIENALQGLGTGVLLTGKPVGAQLDNLGAMVGVRRNGLDDATYTAVILGAIAQNTSDGTHAALLDVVSTVYQTSAVFIKDPNSAGQKASSARAAVAFGVGISGTPAASYDLVNRIVRQSVSAGVGLFYISRFAATGAFAMAGPQAWVRGFGSLANPAAGGGFGALIYNDPTV